MNSKRSHPLIALLLITTAIIFAARRYSSVEAQRHSGTDTYAITNARIVTVSGATIDRGTVVVRDGLIAAVGANATVPADARTIDGTGLTVYPEFSTRTQRWEFRVRHRVPAAVVEEDSGFVWSEPTVSNFTEFKSTPGMQPEILASDLIRAGGNEIESARNVGITTAQTAPRGNVFLGQSAIINLAGDSPQQMIVRSPVALYVGLTPLGGGNYPGSLMGVFSSVRQMLLDARRYRELNDIYERNPRGLKRPAQDKSLEALQPVIAGRMPIVMQADSEREIDRVLDLAKEFNVKMIVNGGREADRVAARLKAMNVPVLLSLNFPKRTTAASPEADPEPLRVLRERVEAPKTAGRLASAGVRFAFQSGGMASIGDYFSNAAKAVDSGLSHDDAVRALTSWPAEVLGVGSQLGSIEVGKIANLTVTRGDLLAKDRRVAHVFIDGKPVDLRPATPNADRGSNVSGTWSLTVNLTGSGNEKQELTATLNLRQETDRLTGSLQGQLGSGSIANGTISGSDVNFTVPITLPAPASQTTDAIFTGTVSGNQMSGSVQVVGRGAGTFTATRAGRPAASPAASPSPDSR